MNREILTPTHHLLARATGTSGAPELATVIERIALAAKILGQELGRSSLRGQLGYTGQTNVQGERVKKLDQWANELFVEVFSGAGPVCTLVSEEMEEPRHLRENCACGYAVLYDPLDGSSNTDVNGVLGTVFGVRRRDPGHRADTADLLRSGREQVAAGYVIFGPGTMLVYTAGAGVNVFTLERGLGEFVLWRENVKMPQRGNAYAVNHGHAWRWHPGARRLVEHLSGPAGKGGGYALRYCGAMVGDFHRCLLEGGMYLYPGEVVEGGNPHGRIRLLYEAAPLAMVAEQAGGRCSDGKRNVLDITPTHIHQRVPCYIGTAEEVAMAERLRVEG